MNKVLLSLATVATLMCANTSNYNYEVTPVIGGVIPEGNLDLDNHLTYGLRFGINLDNSIFDQVELGYDRSSGVDYDNSVLDTAFNRYYANVVKEYKMSSEMALYALVGLGYEDVKNPRFENKDGAFAQYGGGVKYWVTESFALKAEVRHAVKFHEADNNLFYSLGFVIPFDAKTKPVAKAEPAPVVKAEIKDTDGDGVYDDKDKCANTPKNSVVDADGCTKIIRLHVEFAFDKAEVDASYMKEITKVADFMAVNKGYTVVLEGHTDSKGTDKYNQALSERRAKAVAKALTTLGVPANKITTEGYGESKPVASNDTEEGRADNRRVDARFNK
jgi:OmpA-OmpF porin, OOP family